MRYAILADAGILCPCEDEDIRDYNPTIIGAETIDGKEYIVVEYTIDVGSHAKAWIWKPFGIIIRQKVTTSDGIYISEYNNIEFDDIPDSMLELPPGGISISETPPYVILYPVPF